MNLEANSHDNYGINYFTVLILEMVQEIVQMGTVG